MRAKRHVGSGIMLRRDILSGAASLGAHAACSSSAQADDYPSRPIRIIVPFEAGAPDSVARVLGQQLSVQMGKPFVIENRPGANGTIGTAFVARSAPDGYTLLVTSSSFAVNPSLYRSLPYDVFRDFAAVTIICSTEALIIGVNPALPVHSLGELIAYGKEPGHELSFASPGVGNGLHLAAEMFRAKAGIRMIHVPYKGAGPAITALLSGEVQMMFMTPPLSLQYLRAGSIRPLAYTARHRAGFLPGVPSVVEAGMPDLLIDGGWHGLLAPAYTSKEVVTRLQAQVTTALQAGTVRDRLSLLGLNPIGSTTAEYRRVLHQQVTDYATLVRLASIQPE